MITDIDRLLMNKDGKRNNFKKISTLLDSSELLSSEPASDVDKSAMTIEKHRVHGFIVTSQRRGELVRVLNVKTK